MKIRKILVSIFLFTFFLGIIAYFLILKMEIEIERKEIIQTIPQEIVQPKINSNQKLDTIEEVSNHISNYKVPFEIKLLETGESFHGDEVNAKSGEIWQGLFKEKDKFYLQPAKLVVRQVGDPVYEEKTGKSVSVQHRREPYFLLKNAKIPNGEVISLTYDGTLKKDFINIYKLEDKEYSLKVIEAHNKNGDKILALILEGDEKRQILHTMKVEYNPEIGNLYWVGDLDRDGKPDFYMTLFEHDNVINRVFFLSSKAEKGKLVKKVAYFWTTGC